MVKLEKVELSESPLHDLYGEAGEEISTAAEGLNTRRRWSWHLYLIQQMENPCSFQASTGCMQRLTLSWATRQISTNLSCDCPVCSLTTVQSRWKSIEKEVQLCVLGLLPACVSSIHTGVAIRMPCCSLVLWPVH